MPVGRLILASVLAHVLVLSLAVPGAQAAQSTLYFHVADSANMDSIPMTVRPPPEGFLFRSGGGPTAATFSCLSAAGGPGQQSHTVYGIAYGALTEDEVLPQMLRGEARGLAYTLESMANVSLQWFVEVSPQGAPMGPGQAPLPLTNVVVRATMRQGEDSANGISGYEKGLLLAQGQSAPATLAGAQTQGATVHDADGQIVYGFHVPLEVKKDTIPDEGFNVRVDVFVDNPACTATGGTTTPPLVRLHNGPGLRPHLNLSLAHALQVGQAEVTVTESQAGIVHLRVPVNTVWGSYAVANVTVDVQGPGPANNATTDLVLPDAQQGPASPKSPAYFFWHWDAKSARAVAGTYRLDFKLFDANGNAQAGAPANITLQENEDHPPPPDKPAPGLTVVPLLLVALGAAASRRQWKRL